MNLGTTVPLFVSGPPWVAGRLRDAPQILAVPVGLKLSQYLREIVISRLLGHGALPMRPEMLKVIPDRAAEDWCDDRDIPWREVSEEGHRQSREGRHAGLSCVRAERHCR